MGSSKSVVTKIALILLLGATVVAHEKPRSNMSCLNTFACDEDHPKEIKQKCDTTYVTIGGHDCTDCPKCGTPPITFWPDIRCVDDTIGADKVQVWLTPKQLSKLTKLLNLLHLTKTQEQIKGLLGEAPPKKLKE